MLWPDEKQNIVEEPHGNGDKREESAAREEEWSEGQDAHEEMNR